MTMSSPDIMLDRLRVRYQKRLLERLNVRCDELSKKLDEIIASDGKWETRRGEFVQSELQRLESSMIEALARLAPRASEAINKMTTVRFDPETPAIADAGKLSTSVNGEGINAL